MIKEPNNNEASGLVPKYTTENRKPYFYRVVIHNDDFTPMEFVVAILQRYFFMDLRQAARATLEAHTSGKSLCGLFTKDIAESKVQQVIRHARKQAYPLVCSTEAAV